MANPGKTVSFAPRPMIESTSRPGLNMEVSIRQDVRIQSAIDNAIKILVARGFTEIDAHDLVSSIKKPHDEKYRVLEREYFLVRDRCNFLEQQLNLGRDLAPEELVRTNTIAHADDSYTGELVVAPSYIGATTLPPSIANLDVGFQRELEALREENRALILEKNTMNERIKELEQTQEQHLEADAHLQILAKRVEDYKALLLTKETYAAEIDSLTQERNNLATALEELKNNNCRTELHHDSPATNLVKVNREISTDDLDVAMSQRLSELLKINKELYEENQILAAELDRLYSENTDNYSGGRTEESRESMLKKTPLRVRLDVSSITPESITLGLTGNPVNAASTLQATRSKRQREHQPTSLTDVTMEAGTASKFRETDFFDELAVEESQGRTNETEIQVIAANPEAPENADFTRTSSAVSPASRVLIEYRDSKSVSPAYRQAITDTPKKPLQPVISPTTSKYSVAVLQGDPKVELSETQVAELAQQLAMLETEKVKAAREIEQMETAYKALQDTYEDLKRQYDELAHKYAIQENRNQQLEDEHLRMQELFNIKSPDRHISSIDVSQSSQQEKNMRPIHHLARIRESDLDVGDLTSSGHHITEAERFLEDPPSTSAQSFAELPDGDNKTGKVKTVLVWKEKCSQLESRINYVLKDVDILKQEKRDLEEELEELDEQYKGLEARNKELTAEVERLKKLLEETRAETLLFKTTNNGIGKQLKELLTTSTHLNTLASREIATTVTDTALLVEEARDLVETVHDDPPSKVFTEEDVNNMMAELRVELLTLRGEADNHQKAATVFADEIRSLHTKIESLHEDLVARDQSIAQQTEEIKGLSGKILELQSENTRLSGDALELQRKKTELSELQSSHIALLADLNSVTATNRSLAEEVQQLTVQLDSLKAKHPDIKERQDDREKMAQPPVTEKYSVSVETERKITSDVSLLVCSDTGPTLASAPPASFNLLEHNTAVPCSECTTNKKIIDQLTAQNEQASARITELQKQLSTMAITTDKCALLQKENQNYVASNQRLSLQLAEVEQAYTHTTDVIAGYEDQLHRLKEELASVKRSSLAAASIIPRAPTIPTSEVWTQSDKPLTFVQEVQVDFQPFVSPPPDRKPDDESIMASSSSLAIDRFLESVDKTNRILGIKQDPAVFADGVRNSTITLANLIDQHTIRMEERLNEYARLITLQAQRSNDDQQPQESKQALTAKIAQVEVVNQSHRTGLSPDVIATLQYELQLISDHVRANNENISSVARTTELAFNKVREALVTRASEEPQKRNTQLENGSSTELLLYADLLRALLENIIRLNSRLDTMEKDRQGLIAEFAVHLGLSQSTSEEDLKRHIKDLVAAKSVIDPGVLIDNIADLKKGVLETDAQLHYWEENVREHVRATSAPIAANALTIVDHDRSSSLSTVKAEARALQLSNVDARHTHEPSSHHTERTAPNTVEHILHQSMSHNIRSAHGSIQQTLKSIVDATSNCNDAKQRYLEERLDILEAENKSFKEYNASYVKKLAEQTEEITRLQSLNHQLSLKIAEQNSFQEQIQIAEHTRQGITEQIRNVRSTLIEIKTCIQSDRSDGEENDAIPTKESKGIEAVEEKLIELTESACNWRLKYEKANAERKEMRARARTENALRIKVEKAHKKLERNFAQLQDQLKEGAESLAWLKAATARYIEAVQQELDRINGLHLDRE